MFADLFAYTATVFNVFMLFPQVAKTWKTKQTKDLSLASLIMFTLACLLWIFYGIAKQAPPVIIANTVLGMMNLILIFFKYTGVKKVRR